ncbi:MAG TPA: phosphonate ABC transporter, permease protein PhnE [Bacilli bacterium]|nr:phosphonate ABC transporter, permease protein PhnE [Bacilli bacterium]
MKKIPLLHRKKYIITHEEATVERQLKEQPKLWIYNLILAAVIIFLIVYSFTDSQINLSRFANVWPSFKVMINGFANPNTEFLFGLFDADGSIDKTTIPYLTMQTIAIAFVGTIVASIFALPIAFITAKNVAGKHLSKVGEFILVVIRTFPEIILALILIRVFGIGALTGMLTIGLHSIGMLGKLFAEAIENMDRGPIEALDAVGANLWQKIRYAIIPQVLPDFLSMGLYRFDINVRAATILGVVSAGGLGTPLIFASNEWNWPTLSSILIAIILMVVVVDLVSSKLRAKLV